MIDLMVRAREPVPEGLAELVEAVVSAQNVAGVTQADLPEALGRKASAEVIGIRRGGVAAFVHGTPTPVLAAAGGCLAGIEDALEAVTVLELRPDEGAVD